MVPLLEALGNNFNKKETVSFEVTQTAMEGKLVDIHLIPAVFNNKPKREIDGYKPYSGPKVITEQVAGV
jgi:hypothetical protein